MGHRSQYNWIATSQNLVAPHILFASMVNAICKLARSGPLVLLSNAEDMSVTTGAKYVELGQGWSVFLLDKRVAWLPPEEWKYAVFINCHPKSIWLLLNASRFSSTVCLETDKFMVQVNPQSNEKGA
jgi:hypothetical protein